MVDETDDILRSATRLDALRRTALLDSAPEEAFDRLTRLAARVLHVPEAQVTLVDDRRQFFKSQVGLPASLAAKRETPLSHSFCKHAVESREPLIVPDARLHPVLRHNPAIAERGLIAYAGIPLIDSCGQALGSFCVVDHAPRAWTEDDIGVLRVLASATMNEIELRGAAAELSVLSGNLQSLVESRTAELRTSEARQRLLLDLNNAVVTCLDRDSLFAAVAKALQRVIPFDRAALVLHDAARDVFTVLGVATPTPSIDAIPLGTEWPREGGRSGFILDTGKPLLTPDLRAAAPFVEHPYLLREGILSAASVPMAIKGRIIGTLNVGSRDLARYDENDVSLLVAIAEQVALAIENLLAYEQIATLKRRLEEENLYLQEEARTEAAFGEVVGRSTGILGVLARVRDVAETDSTVLLTGETGTGKELIVRAIHGLSPRRDKILVKVNCAALPAGVVESELFGHEKGAFTGALARKIGRFEIADGGTLFLDEVGDLPMELQAKLLRVLQEGEFERVGGTRTLKVQVRLITATNRDLGKAVADGSFRADLFYRLAVFPIHVPPLRERRDDVPDLVRHFVAIYAAKLGKKIAPPSTEALNRLRAYAWPGNVRELQNVIERAVILAKKGRLEVGDALVDPARGVPKKRARSLEEVERQHILAVLEETGWRVSGEKGAAKVLGLKRTTLEAKMQKLGIVRPT